MKFIQINLVAKIMALTFALPLKKGWQSTAKSSLKVRKQQHSDYIGIKVSQAKYIRFDTLISEKLLIMSVSNNIYNGEFDPGSG